MVEQTYCLWIENYDMKIILEWASRDSYNPNTDIGHHRELPNCSTHSTFYHNAFCDIGILLDLLLAIHYTPLSLLTFLSI